MVKRIYDVETTIGVPPRKFYASDYLADSSRVEQPWKLNHALEYINNRCARTDFLFKMIAKTMILQLLLLLVFYDHVTSLIIPEELPTILSLIYSNIPPIKKGTDSRLGVGFRLGEHADFQILIELGPQTETGPIGTSNDAKRRRDAAFSAAMKGELGPLAQAVAKYQIENRIQKEVDKLKLMEEKLKKIQTEDIKDQDTVSSDWLTKWRKEISQSSKDNKPLSSEQNRDDKLKVQQIIGKTD